MARSSEKVPAREDSAPAQEGHLPVSELVADRAAAPSPFGDDLTFPLPVESLKYIHASKP